MPKNRLTMKLNRLRQKLKDKKSKMFRNLRSKGMLRMKMNQKSRLMLSKKLNLRLLSNLKRLNLRPLSNLKSQLLRKVKKHPKKKVSHHQR